MSPIWSQRSGRKNKAWMHHRIIDQVVHVKFDVQVPWLLPVFGVKANVTTCAIFYGDHDPEWEAEKERRMLTRELKLNWCLFVLNTYCHAYITNVAKMVIASYERIKILWYLSHPPIRVSLNVSGISSLVRRDIRHQSMAVCTLPPLCFNTQVICLKCCELLSVER